MNQRIVVLPDLHVPDQNEEALKPVFQFIKYYKPTTIVQLGDLCNYDSLSSYEPRNAEAIKNTLTQEVGAANGFIDSIDRLSHKKVRKIIVGGNHEARYPKYKVNHGFKTDISMLHKFTSWQEEYNLPKRGWESCEYGEVIEIGHIIFTHGWWSSGNHAQRHLHAFHKNIFYGHSHGFQIATGAGLDHLPIMSASLGTLSKSDLAYLVGKPPVNWVNMFAYVDMRDNGTFTPHFTTIVKGRFIELGREFGGDKK